jgi:hypothetical protein
MVRWGREIAQQLYFDREKMKLVSFAPNNERESNAKEELRHKIIEKKYLEKEINHKNQTEEKIALAKSKLKESSAFLLGKIQTSFTKARSAKINLNDSHLQRFILERRFSQCKVQLGEVQSDSERKDIERKLEYVRGQLRCANKAVSGYESEYESACRKIDQDLPFDLLKIFAESQYDLFMKMISNSNKKSEDKILCNLARYVTITSYVLQMKIEKARKKVGNDIQAAVPPLWYELDHIKTLLNIKFTITCFESDSLVEPDKDIRLIENALDRIEKIDVTQTTQRMGSEEKSETIKYKKKQYEQLKIYGISRVMQASLTLLAKKISPNQEFLDEYIQTIEQFFSNKNHDLFLKLFTASDFETMKSAYTSCIAVLREKRKLLPSHDTNDEDVINLDDFDTTSAPTQDHKKFLRIKSEISDAEIYITADEILYFIKEVSSQHYNFPDSSSNALSITLSLINTNPSSVSDDEYKDNFLSYNNLARISQIKKSGTVLNYGEWCLWLRSDLYVMILEGHASSGWYKCKQYSHTYDSMRPGIVNNSTNLVKNIRIFLQENGSLVKTTEQDYDQARFVVAKFISEPARNWHIWIINLMLLDLLEDGFITWDTFFRIHPMRGGSYTETTDNGEIKKKSQIDNDMAMIAMNWLKIYWPNAEYVEMVDTCSPDYGQTAAARIHHIEAYYRNKVILPLLLKRMNSTRKWDHVFDIEEYVELPFLGEEPYRIGGQVFFSEDVWTAAALSKKTEELATFVINCWKIDDKIEICTRSKDNIQEILARAEEMKDSKLREFYEFKLEELASKLTFLFDGSAKSFHSFKPFREILPIRLQFISIFNHALTVGPICYPHTEEEYITALGEVLTQLEHDLITGIGGVVISDDTLPAKDPVLFLRDNKMNDTTQTNVQHKAKKLGPQNK